MSYDTLIGWNAYRWPAGLRGERTVGKYDSYRMPWGTGAEDEPYRGSWPPIAYLQDLLPLASMVYKLYGDMYNIRVRPYPPGHKLPSPPPWWPGNPPSPYPPHPWPIPPIAGGYVSIGFSNEGPEAPAADTWSIEDDRTKGVEVIWVFRPAYYDSGLQTLWGYIRGALFDRYGHLTGVSAEIRIAIDVPDLCA